MIAGGLVSSAGATATTATTAFPAMVLNWFIDGKLSGPLRGSRIGHSKGNRKEQTIRQKAKRQLASRLAEEARKLAREAEEALAEQEQNAATTLRVLDPCPEPCYLCEEYDEPDYPHPIVPGTTVGHCAKSRLPWHARHICVPCQAELDAILGWADGAGPTSEGAGAGAGGGEAGDGEQGHSRARDGVR